MKENSTEPKAGQIWINMETTELFLITEIKSPKQTYPVKVLIRRNTVGEYMELIRDAQYSALFVKNMCEYQGMAKNAINDMFKVADKG